MNREDWNVRYAAAELVWSAEPNRFLVDEVAELSPGRALDVACGEGRNAVWLAERGWTVTAVDFSSVALDKGRQVAEARGVEVDWVEADVATYLPERGAYDLVALLYLHLPADQRAVVLERCAASLAPPIRSEGASGLGGTLLGLGHDRRNLDEGVGGPQDPAILWDADEVVAQLPGLRVVRAERVHRPVGAGTAIDTLVRVTSG